MEFVKLYEISSTRSQKMAELWSCRDVEIIAFIRNEEK